VNLEKIDCHQTGTNVWTPQSVWLEDYIDLTATVQLRFGASDGSGMPSIVEAAVDDVMILGFPGCIGNDECEEGDYCDDDGDCVPYGDGDFDGDGDIDLMDLARFMGCFGTIEDETCAAANLAGDESIDLTDYAAMAEIVDGPK
jgi:hypothetical protein